MGPSHALPYGRAPDGARPEGRRRGHVLSRRQAEGVDYWRGRPTANGFTFAEKRHFVKSSDLLEAWGISTDGSAIFGDYYQDGDLIVYFTASHRERDNWGQCQNYAPAWGDSHGDILVGGGPGGPNEIPAPCVAQPKY
jgi:hypothetical protein